MQFQNTIAFARSLDAQDPLRDYRNQFYIPKKDGEDTIYLCGNSLGLQPKATRDYLEVELKAWEDFGVEGHFMGTNPWMYYHKMFAEPTARLVGALPTEVVVMNNLSVNLNLMLVSFYKPTKQRYKIMIEGGAFPSDYYAVEQQLKFHGFGVDDIIELTPKEGEYNLRTADIIAEINKHADSLALVMLGGVNYYTGQAFEMAEITVAAHKVGALAGYDLAHAAGNLHMHLHDWNVDFAVWCTYKYLNSGPGGTSGVFVHERWCNDATLPRFAGWWGHDEASRFQMKKGFIPMQGAQGWQMSNAQILPMAAHKASLDIFDKAGIENLRSKSDLLTAYCEFLLREKEGEFTIITPKEIKHRGAQLSLLMGENGRQIFDRLTSKGVIADWREPNVIRIAPVPLYNTFEDVYRFAEIVHNA
ncbi:MAG: kynureninase [Bacteroidetes bacterium]|nr:kynureninase [Bacteroidota bacterium]